MSDGIGGEKESVFERRGHEQKYGNRSIVVGRVYRSKSFKEFYQATYADPTLIIMEIEPGQGAMIRRAEGKREISELLDDVIDFSKSGQLDMARTYLERARWLEGRANNGFQLS